MKSMKFKHVIISILFIGSALVFFSCANSPDYSDTPALEFVSLSKMTMVQGISNSDTILLTVSFTDGDGDIGFGEETVGPNIVITDKRTGLTYDNYRIPTIPEQGANNGVNGEIRMVLLNTCCIFPDNIPPCMTPEEYPTNELDLTMHLIDRAEHKSNELVIPTINLLCQ